MMQCEAIGEHRPLQIAVSFPLQDQALHLESLCRVALAWQARSPQRVAVLLRVDRRDVNILPESRTEKAEEACNEGIQNCCHGVKEAPRL